MRPLESVPNFSAGRDPATIEAIASALADRARLLDVHTDPDHDRSVFTLLGQGAELVEALLAGVLVARERIDLRAHAGVHPRVGAADVLPIVPIDPGDLDRARGAALALAARIGALGLPVFLYAPPARGPAFYRRGGVEELQRRLDAGELRPDFGPARLDPSAGAVILGARQPLVALNVDLDGPLQVAKEIAAAVRETGGGFRGVRALGVDLATRGLVQVSMNIEDWRASPPREVVDRIRSLALEAGTPVARVELVGLIPAGAAAGLEGIGASQVLESRLAE